MTKFSSDAGSQEIQESKPERSKSKKAKKLKFGSDAGSQEIRESKPERSKTKKKSKPKKAKRYGTPSYEDENYPAEDDI